eukprot:1180377-Prorocentrum_minimum.AAC.1
MPPRLTRLAPTPGICPLVSHDRSPLLRVRTLVLKLEARKREIQYAAEMAALKCQSEEEKAKLAERMQASTGHIDLLVGSIERLDCEVQQMNMHTVTVQENEKLLSQQLNIKMRRVPPT